MIDKQSTEIVSEIPVQQFTAISDKCTNQIKCTYAESLDLTTTFKKWYELDQGKIIFYLTRKAYSYNEYIALRN